MRRTWQLWLAWTRREVDPRPLAAVRIAVCTVLLGDLASVVWRGLEDAVWLPSAAGGLGAPTTMYAHWGLGGLVGMEAGGTVAALVAASALMLGALGVAARPSLFTAAVALSQLAALAPASDRGIDRLLRTALLVLAASPCARAWTALPPRGTQRGTPLQIPAWPTDLLRYLLVLVYTGAGAAKLVASPHWLSVDGTPELYRVLADPMTGTLDAHALLAWWPALRFLGAATVFFELAAPLVWTRHARIWIAGGIILHLSTAFALDLGLFPFGILSLYPCFWRVPAPQLPQPATIHHHPASTKPRPAVGKTLHDGS